MRAAIIGATGGVGRALAEALARRGHHLLITATDARDLAALRAHVELSYGVSVQTAVVRVGGDGWLAALSDALERYGVPDAMFFPIGLSYAHDDGLLPAEAARTLIEVNFAGIVDIVTLVLPAMLERRHGWIVGFGSVAQDRGRSANAVYAAAKRGLTSYFESLRHRVADTDVRVQLYQLGYVDTQQTFGKRLVFPACSPRYVAERVAHRLGSGGGVRYLPGYWRIVTLLLRWTPWIIFRRLKL
ncbi:MAG TPA: SDR family NAD(P)-dependent oxidoreductase [Burkholderiales bacterium]|nr:SDR family NAD(P)-dependent oxidoreductase [Burkholderiales bacterium]